MSSRTRNLHHRGLQELSINLESILADHHFLFKNDRIMSTYLYLQSNRKFKG